MAAVPTGRAQPTENTVTRGNLITLAGTESVSGTVGNYSIVPVHWRGQINKDGPETTITGPSYEHIYHYLLKHAPHTIKPVNATAKQQVKKRDDGYPSVSTRTALSWIQPHSISQFTLCNRLQFGYFNWPKAGAEASNYLHHLTGECTLNDRKDTCGRVSCSWNSGVFYCNDATHSQWMWCSEIGDYFDRIAETCMPQGDDGNTPAVFNGQKFRTDTQYSILMGGIGGDRC